MSRNSKRRFVKRKRIDAMRRPPDWHTIAIVAAWCALSFSPCSLSFIVGGEP